MLEQFLFLLCSHAWGSRFLSPVAHWNELECLPGTSNLTYCRRGLLPASLIPPCSRRPLLLYLRDSSSLSVNGSSVFPRGSAKILGIILDSFVLPPILHIQQQTLSMTFKAQPESDPTLPPLPFLPRTKLLSWPLDDCHQLPTRSLSFSPLAHSTPAYRKS